MNLNPITAITDKLEKLINEHGSAAILRDHVALLKEKALAFEQDVSKSKEENTVLQAENLALKNQIKHLQSEIQNLKKPHTATSGYVTRG